MTVFRVFLLVVALCWCGFGMSKAQKPALGVGAGTSHLAARSNLTNRAQNYFDQIETDNSEVIHSRFRFRKATLDSWFVYWADVNWLGDNDIEPTLILSPAVTLAVLDFDVTLSYEFGTSSGGFVFGLERTDELAALTLEGVASDVQYTGNDDKIRTNFEIGRFHGTGFFEFIEDTLSYEWKTEQFKINSTSVNLAAFWRFVGLQFISYKMPLLVRSEEVPDPRDPNETIVKIEMPETKVRHLFFVVEPLYNLHSKPSNQKFSIGYQGHFRMLLFGLGYAENDYLGTVGTWSLNSIFGNPKEVRALSFFNGFDIDAGVTARLRFGDANFLQFALGVRWRSWQIRSFMTEVDGLDMQMFSSNAHVGPYTQLMVTF